MNENAAKYDHNNTLKEIWLQLPNWPRKIAVMNVWLQGYIWSANTWHHLNMNELLSPFKSCSRISIALNGPKISGCNVLTAVHHTSNLPKLFA